MKKEHKILKNTVLSTLEKQMNDLEESGFEPRGNLLQNDKGEYIQTMIKYDKQSLLESLREYSYDQVESLAEYINEDMGLMLGDDEIERMADMILEFLEGDL